MELHCNYCGKVFTTYKFWQPERFCSPACRESFEIKQQLTKPRFKPKNCRYCGKTFSPNAGHQVFCSSACCQHFHYENQKELSQKYTEDKKTEKPKGKKTLDDYAREADECGLSYGKYKLQLKLGKTYEELKAAHLAEVNRMEEF